MIEIRALEKQYGGRTVLSLSPMTWQPGEIVAVIGANGSGKSTMAKLLAGVLREERSPFQSGVTVGYLPQKPYAFRMSVRKNVLLGGSGEVRAEHLLERMQLLPLAGQRADRLSGGECARMAVARLLMRDYELLICDEPTAAMDVEMSLETEKLLQETCRQKKSTLLLITHNLQQARRMADRVLFLHRGTLMEEGRPEDILTNPVSGELRQFLDCYGQ